MKHLVAVGLSVIYLVGCNVPPQAPLKASGAKKGGQGESNPNEGDCDLKKSKCTSPPTDKGEPSDDDATVEEPTNPPKTGEVEMPPKTGEVEMPKTPETPKVSAALSADLMARSSASTKVSNTPMGRWFKDAVNKKATAEEMAFLEDPNQNVPTVKGWAYKKFQVKLYPTGGKPHPADGYQTAIGDCNMLAMLNSFAYQHPDFLKSIIKDKGNGTFEVQMFDPQQKRITVGLNSDFLASGNDLTAVRGVNNTAIWLTVLEKAIMKYNQVFKIWNGDGPAKVEGFGSEAGAPMLTGEGNSYSFDRGALKSKEDLTRVVKEALAAGKLITGGFGTPMTMDNLNSVTGHAYTVMVPPNANIMITMRNPWGVSPKASGGSDESHDGILDIKYDQKWFNTIDLRVMEPGIAGVTGNTGPYQPRGFNLTAMGFSADDMAFQLEMHQKYGFR